MINRKSQTLKAECAHGLTNESTKCIIPDVATPYLQTQQRLQNLNTVLQG